MLIAAARSSVTTVEERNPCTAFRPSAIAWLASSMTASSLFRASVAPCGSKYVTE